eukprot:TRINITY_DN1558_c0_g1_i1.p1 TRINITY_DN1558_c0_g1~~TRINITY_DN1558_c0_g1_i1.p1  ORF type:complete len:96 (+),score=15.81 TRINITY_DN1558_c0_g1_i1:85-372(+)
METTENSDSDEEPDVDGCKNLTPTPTGRAKKREEPWMPNSMRKVIKRKSHLGVQGLQSLFETPNTTTTKTQTPKKYRRRPTEDICSEGKIETRQS